MVELHVEMHLGLARSIAGRVYRLMGGRVELDDLVAHALAGLSEAACRYRPDAATPFGSFAQYRIRGAIFDWLRSMGYLQRRRTRKLAAPSPGADTPGDAPGPAADAPGDAVFLHLAAWKDDDLALSMSSPEPPADALLAAKHTRSFVAKVLHRLPARERRFIRKHYFEGKTMAKAGAELGLSRYQSCRLHARVVAHLRELLAAAGVRCFEDV